MENQFLALQQRHEQNQNSLINSINKEIYSNFSLKKALESLSEALENIKKCNKIRRAYMSHTIENLDISIQEKINLSYNLLGISKYLDKMSANFKLSVSDFCLRGFCCKCCYLKLKMLYSNQLNPSRSVSEGTTKDSLSIVSLPSYPRLSCNCILF